ncbi:hypothetical protein D3C86_1935100 [compost metagenome]
MAFLVSVVVRVTDSVSSAVLCAFRVKVTPGIASLITLLWRTMSIPLTFTTAFCDLTCSFRAALPITSFSASSPVTDTVISESVPVVFEDSIKR